MSNPRRSIVRSTLSQLRRLWQRRSNARRDFNQRLGSTFEQLQLALKRIPEETEELRQIVLQRLEEAKA